ncbi:MAG TPA: APC family permease [Acidimicrobiales bacterium]
MHNLRPHLGAARRGTDEAREQITSLQGLSALSLDALTSISYGPEAMLVILATAGAGALWAIEPVTGVIVLLLALLVLSYRQVIEAYPNGGGAYAVSKDNFGHRASLLAGASLIVDYVLTVAVSIAAGVAALISAFPSLAKHPLIASLTILVLLTVINLRGLATSARLFIIPTAVFIIGTYAVIAAGLLRSGPAPGSGVIPAPTAGAVSTVGLLLLLKAFANGCSALTGVEAIANDVPAFREPRAVRARRTEVMLGAILGSMLMALAVLTVKFHITPRPNVTVLSQITSASVGRGAFYFIVDLTTTLVLCLAANTAFGGLPNLASILAHDNLVPHVFALKGERQVYRYGVVSLAVLAGILLIAVNGNTNSLIPLYAIGVFTGFTLSQSGLVRHWFKRRPPGWRNRAMLNGVGAVLTAVALVIFLATKFTAGAWVVVIAIPAFMYLFSRVYAYYQVAGNALGLGSTPPRPTRDQTVVIVPINRVSKLVANALGFAESMGDRVMAVTVQPDDDRAAEVQAEWSSWNPGVELVVLRPRSRAVTGPIIAYVSSPEVRALGRVVVLIPEIEPQKWRYQVLQNQRGVILANRLYRETDVVVARLPFRLKEDSTRPQA